MLQMISTQLTWSRLAVFGNSYLGRAVIVTPAVALYVRYEADFLLNSFGLTHALWLYWSLIMISAGQLIYFTSAPATIKKYGADQERFKVEDANARTDYARTVLKRQHIQSFFIPHGGPLKPYDPELAESVGHRTDLKRTAEGFRDYVLDGPPLVKSFDKHGMMSIVELHPSYLTASYADETEAVRNAMSGLDRIFQAAYIQSNAIKQKTPNREWDLEALDWEFKTLDEGKFPARLAVGTLYILGAIYFIYSALRGIALMILFTLGVS